MDLISKDKADLITLDAGQAYFAGRQYNMMPIMAEEYNSAVMGESLNRFDYIYNC